MAGQAQRSDAAQMAESVANVSNGTATLAAPVGMVKPIQRDGGGQAEPKQPKELTQRKITAMFASKTIKPAKSSS